MFHQQCFMAASSTSLRQQQDFAGPSVVSCSKQCFLRTWEGTCLRIQESQAVRLSTGTLNVVSSSPTSDVSVSWTVFLPLQHSSSLPWVGHPMLVLLELLSSPSYFAQNKGYYSFCPLILVLPSTVSQVSLRVSESAYPHPVHLHFPFTLTCQKLS